MGNIGLSTRHSGHQRSGRGDRAVLGPAEFHDRLSGARQLAAAGSPIPATSTVRQDQHHEVAGQHDFKGGLHLHHLTLDDWQPRRGQPARQFTFATNATRTFGTGAQTGNFYNQYAAFLLGLVGTAEQELSVPVVHRRGVAARAVLPRPLERQPEADAGPRAALEGLPDHGPGRFGRDRDARPEYARRGDRRRRRTIPRTWGSTPRRTASRRESVRCIA